MNGTARIKIRRDSAKKRLEEQIKRNTKPEKVDGKTTNKTIPLTPADISRINREIDVLNNPKK